MINLTTGGHATSVFRLAKDLCNQAFYGKYIQQTKKCFWVRLQL